MPTLVKLTTLDAIPPGTAREFEHDGRIIALFHREGGLVAVDGICPHQGGPLAEGEVVGGVVTCPWHGWQFDLASGRALLSSRVCLPVYPVEVRGAEVFVALP
jgi:nitrite reductase/ring-hydroxylating ferredoxin subunit